MCKLLEENMSRYSLFLTRERLMEVLSFDADHGRFIWLSSGTGRRKVGGIAGCLNSCGYRVIGVDGQVYYAHQLTWLLFHGEWPCKDIDHKDRNRDNNRISNLRLATEAENQWNTITPKDNTSGHKGVFRLHNKWTAQIQKNNKRKHLGMFERFEDACAAYDAAAKTYHGEFAVT
jgi:HNH endonuclease/AP2 domain